MTLTFTKNDFVMPPFLPCPKCGHEEFGVFVDSGPQGYRRRCRRCGEQGFTQLPPVAKKLHFLDQHMHSEVAKTIWPSIRPGRQVVPQHRWGQIWDRLRELVRTQALLCPAAHEHETESKLSNFSKWLGAVRGQLSSGEKFWSTDHVERFQLNRHFRLWLAGRGEEQPELRVSDCLKADPSDWTSNLRITVRMPELGPRPKRIRRSRRKLATTILEIFRGWQANKAATFDDHFRNECAGMGTGILKATFQNSAQISAAFRGQIKWLPAIHPASQKFFELIHVAQELGHDDQAAHFKVFEYLGSDKLQFIPSNRIRASLWAALAMRAARGQQKQPSAGMSTDIGLIAAYLPYCDALFVDQQCRTLLEERDVREKLGFPVRVFSARNQDEYVQHLADLQAGTPAEQIRHADELYGKFD